ncbi:hypothetical protein OG563_06140 [Nocardia vinacea]|uniref:Bulb-type lectin domain-containing protein n=1 Tax=Nocardia vinacea TaxID=96468 RepID=A0ABZ1Z128_9NOCA|nr:hypothetical protein [Nocardia vinacea]
MADGYFYQWIDGEFKLVNGIGSTPDTNGNGDSPEGYYYASRSDGSMQLYHCNKDGDYQAINYHGNNVVDPNGNLHAFDNTDGVNLDYTEAARESSGHLSDEHVEGFDPPPPAPDPNADENKLPEVADRRDDRLLAGETLAPEDSSDVAEGKARSSLTNGDYTLTLDSDNRLVLTDKDGNELWGYAGADAAELLSQLSLGQYDVKIGLDGSIKVIDPKDGSVVKVVREASDAKHAKLVLLYHPPAESLKLQISIDEAQSALQLQVDCFAKGKASLAEDVGDWLHDHGLGDKENTSSLTLSYNESYLNYDTHTKEHFKDLDEQIRSIAVNTDLVNSEAFKKIETAIDELDEALRAIDAEEDVQYNVLIDRPENMTAQAWAHIPDEDKHHDRIIPDLEQDLLDLINKTVATVDKEVDNANQAMEEHEGATDKNSPEYKAGLDDGYKDGYADGLAAGQGDGTTTTDDGTADVPTDWSDSFSDLLTNGETGGTDDTSGSTGQITTAGTGNSNSGILNAINSAMDKIEASKNSGGGNSNNNGNGNGNSNSGGNSAAGLVQAMQLMSLMSGLNQGKDKDRDKDKDKDEDSRAGMRPADQGAVQAAQAAATNPAAVTDSGVVSATASTPPQLSTSGSAMVDMKLPDGSTQKVSSAVAQAVNKELNNPNGSDARSAYAGTSGAASPSGPWNAVDSSHLRTGDVVQWENRSGLVVVDSAGLQVIVNGQLVPLDPNNPPGGVNGGYGNFQGFFHPSGVDVQATVQQADVPAAPGAVTAPPSAPTVPPAVSAPAASI